MACDITIPESNFSVPTTEIEVIDKFKQLSEAALATDSIYMRAKDTFRELFENKKVSESEYAQLASQFVSQLAVSTTQQAMQAAMQWAIEERESAFKIESMKVQNDLVLAQREKTKYEICKLEKDIALQCATVKTTTAANIRKNGRIQSLDADGCTVTALYDEGTEYMQAKALESQMYATLSDAYRKSGVVQIATDADGVKKGVSADDQGYTNAQEKFALRQIVSFEDSKRSHAANAMSQMIGQLLASEIVADQSYVNQWEESIAYLNTASPTTP